MTNAYKYLMEAGGLEEESSYPYTGKKDECKFKPDKVAVRVTNFTNIPIDENQIAANLVYHGPLAGISLLWPLFAVQLYYRPNRLSNFSVALINISTIHHLNWERT